jgi:quercetin dioxygenase-like cupin family protein
MKIIETPQMTILHTGLSFKVFQVTGQEGMCIPEHFSTKEAVIIIQKGSAVLRIKGRDHALQQYDSFIIPASEKHMLTIKKDFQANVIMENDSQIKFVNN